MQIAGEESGRKASKFLDTLLWKPNPFPPGAHLVRPECCDAVLCCVQHREAEGGGGGGEEGDAALQHVHRSLMVWGEFPLHGIVCGVVELR